MKDTVTLIEVGPRDGLQNEKTLLSTSDKLTLIDHAVAAGIRKLEATSFVNPARVPAMADAEEVMAALNARPYRKNIHVIGLVLNKRGAERAVAAGVDELGFTMAASDSFGQRNQGMTREEGLAAWREVAALAGSANKAASIMVSTVWACPFEGNIPMETVGKLAAAIAEIGPHELGLADTIGAAAPAEVVAVIDMVKKVAPKNPLRLHFHNTRNMAVANAWAGYKRGGVLSFDASLGGIGGCPFAPNATGNVGTEDLAYLFQRSGVDAGIDLARLVEGAKWLTEKLGHELPGMVSRAPLL